MCVIFAKEIARVFLVVLRGSFLLQKAVVSKCEHAGSLLSQPLTVVGNQDLPSRQWLMYCSENNSVLGKPKGFKLLFVVINLKTQVSLKLLIKKNTREPKTFSQVIVVLTRIPRSGILSALSSCLLWLRQEST